MEFLNRKPQLQPKWPLRVGPEDGPYEAIKNTVESINQNFIFLLQTIPGEWPMNPDLGVGIARYLFEGYRSPELDEFKSRLKNQLSKYLPQIKLINSNFIHSDSDQDSLTTILRITYSVELLGIIQEIDFGLDNSNKTNVTIRSSNSKIGKEL